MSNFNRMTIRQAGDQFQVFKLKPQSAVSATGGGHRPTVWFVSAAASPRFIGTHGDCCDFIAKNGGQFTSEHGLPV